MLGLVRADVVEDDDVAGVQLAEEDPLHEGLENVRVGCPFHRHEGSHATDVERADHRRDLRPIPGHAAVDPLSSRSAPVLAGHRDVAAGFVQEDKTLGVERLGVGDEPPPELLDPRLRLLGGAQALLFA